MKICRKLFRPMDIYVYMIYSVSISLQASSILRRLRPKRLLRSTKRWIGLKNCNRSSKKRSSAQNEMVTKFCKLRGQQISRLKMIMFMLTATRNERPLNGGGQKRFLRNSPRRSSRVAQHLLHRCDLNLPPELLGLRLSPRPLQRRKPSRLLL